MKIKTTLRYSCAVILVIVAIFFSIGIFIPSLNFENKVSVEKPADISFRVFTSPFSLSAWIPGLKNVKWLSGKTNEVGSKWEMIIEDDGNEYVMAEELVAYKENELFVVKMENEDILDTIEVRFTGKGTESEIFSSNHVMAKSFLERPFLLLFKSKLEGQNHEMHKKLKRLIETIN